MLPGKVHKWHIVIVKHHIKGPWFIHTQIDNIDSMRYDYKIYI